MLRRRSFSNPSHPGFVAQSGFWAHAKWIRRHDMHQWVSPRNETTHLFAKKLPAKKNSMLLSIRCPVSFEIFLSEEDLVNCLGKQQMTCVCNNLLWDACLWCKHWTPQVVVNGRKILRTWQKGSMLNMPNAVVEKNEG